MKFNILSVAEHTPPKIIHNSELEKELDTSDEWIYSRTGIRQRHISEGQTSADLGALAARKAIEKAKIDIQDIDIIVVATSTSYYKYFPSTACCIQDQLGIESCCAYDVSAACSGFVYAFINAVQALQCNKHYKHALIIGTEVFSQIVDWSDRSTCILFGDGAGACLISNEQTEFSTQASIMHSNYLNNSIGQINYLTGGNPVKGDNSKLAYLQMDGRKVFDFAIKVLPQIVDTLLENIEIQPQDLDYIVAHQANARIISSVARKMGLPIEKFFVNIENYANTSAASIPIALAEMNDKNLLQKGQKIVLAGFGAGLTYGGVLLEW